MSIDWSLFPAVLFGITVQSAFPSPTTYPMSWRDRHIAGHCGFTILEDVDLHLHIHNNDGKRKDDTTCTACIVDGLDMASSSELT